MTIGDNGGQRSKESSVNALKRWANFKTAKAGMRLLNC
jgi:hypothetical protein